MHIPHLPSIPAPAGHYSTCIAHGGLLYLSGQLPRHPDSGAIPDGIKEQTELVLANTNLILAQAGTSKNLVLQVRIYIPDVELWPTVNEVYAAYFGDHKPARVIVPTTALHYGAMIEVEMTAVLPNE